MKGDYTFSFKSNVSTDVAGPLDAHTYWNTLAEALDITEENDEVRGIPLKSRIKGFKFVVRDDGTGQPAGTKHARFLFDWKTNSEYRINMIHIFLHPCKNIF
jgi:hypothetical protein